MNKYKTWYSMDINNNYLKSMRKKKIAIVLICLIILLIIAFFSYIIISNKKDVGQLSNGDDSGQYKTKEQIEKIIKREIGEKYFKENFKFIKTYIATKRLNQGMRYRYNDYEFLPFSGKHKYIVSIRGSYDYPPCVYEKTPNSCSFNYSYSEAYDDALLLLRNDFGLDLMKDEEGYFWLAQSPAGIPPGCNTTHRSFSMNTENGSKSQIKTWVDTMCWDF